MSMTRQSFTVVLRNELARLFPDEAEKANARELRAANARRAAQKQKEMNAEDEEPAAEQEEESEKKGIFKKGKKSK